MKFQNISHNTVYIYTTVLSRVCKYIYSFSITILYLLSHNTHNICIIYRFVCFHWSQLIQITEFSGQYQYGPHLVPRKITNYWSTIDFGGSFPPVKWENSSSLISVLMHHKDIYKPISTLYHLFLWQFRVWHCVDNNQEKIMYRIGNKFRI